MELWDFLEPLSRMDVDLREEWLAKHGLHEAARSALLDKASRLDRMTGGPFHEGRVLGGRYELLGSEPIGKGRSSMVWKALDRNNMPRKVALKIVTSYITKRLRPTSPLLDEVKKLISLTHENVIRVFESHAEGLPPFIVLELWEGAESLAHFCKSSAFASLDAAGCVRMVLGAAKGAQAAYLKNVFHGDISPGNVLISPGDELKVALIDFGDAGGTEGYRAPERSDLDEHSSPDSWQRADVFSLGCLTRAILDERHLDVPELNRLLSRCCNQDASRRPCIGALVADLQRFVDARPLSDTGWRFDFRWKALRRREPAVRVIPFAAIAAATVLVSFVATQRALRGKVADADKRAQKAENRSRVANAAAAEAGERARNAEAFAATQLANATASAQLYQQLAHTDGVALAALGRPAGSLAIEVDRLLRKDRQERERWALQLADAGAQEARLVLQLEAVRAEVTSLSLTLADAGLREASLVSDLGRAVAAQTSLSLILADAGFREASLSRELESARTNQARLSLMLADAGASEQELRNQLKEAQKPQAGTDEGFEFGTDGGYRDAGLE